MQSIPVRRMAIAFVALAALMTVVAIAGNAEEISTPSAEPGPRADPRPSSGEFGEYDLDDAQGQLPSGDTVEFPPIVGYIIAAMIAMVVLYYLSKVRLNLRFAHGTRVATGAAPMTEEEEAEAIVALTVDLIDEINAGDDPRHAIQRAYAAVETGFGRLDFARKPAETPLKYLDRVLGKRQEVAEPLARLTELFQIARFSDRPVDEPMRASALEALGEIRDQYQRQRRHVSR